ncbi:MAG TPA: DUF2194 domain-containing protein [Candidatus Mediterraneibacter excrementavium]|nr:DUF2194 domain-containing protein [Candidatus Mediterraneibacter excrementavium]
MISRANYIAITLIMCVVLLMFQLTGISENVLMNTGENIYSAEAVPEGQISLEMTRYEQQGERLYVSALQADKDTVGLIGTEDEDCLSVAREWSISQKREYCYYENIGEAAADENGAGFLIIDGEKLGSAEDVEMLKSLAEQGRDLVVSGLPDVQVMDRNRDLMRALGILRIEADEIEVDGFKLFAGLVIGGETVYMDYEQQMPYAMLDDSVTAYAVAQSEDAWIQDVENEELPAIIWRYAPDVGKVYVVNGDYLTGQLGAGILTGFAADTDEVYVYPVANAQVSVVENYPVLTNENPEVMEQEYGQDSSIVFRDILWPSIVAIYYDTDDAMTVTAAPRLDYDDQGELNKSLMDFYYEQVTKETGEIGLSGYQVSDVLLREKLKEDLELYQEVLPDYEIRTFQAGGLEEEDYERLVGKGHLLSDVDTVLTDYDGDSADSFFSYLDNGVLQLPVYMDSRVMEDEDDFRSRCLQTAYGYYGTAVDTSKVIYSESDDDSWNIISNDWSKNYRPYRTPFEAFEKTTATEADRRVRNYLALEYEAQIGEDRIEITADSPDGASYYVVRIHGKEIGEVTGGTCEEIEKGWYLVTVEDESVQITLEQTNHADYYIE